jgi:hypothetical protein
MSSDRVRWLEIPENHDVCERIGGPPQALAGPFLRPRVPMRVLIDRPASESASVQLASARSSGRPSQPGCAHRTSVMARAAGAGRHGVSSGAATHSRAGRTLALAHEAAAVATMSLPVA